MTVFEYDSPIPFLEAVFRQKKERNAQFSLRAWASSMGLKDPTALFRALNGERKIKFPLVRKFAESIGLEGADRRYFELLVLRENASEVEERDLFSSLLNDLRAQHANHVPASSESFSPISEWSTTFALRRSDFGKIKALIEDSHKSALEHSAQENAEEVYQFCSQLFRLTRDPNQPPLPGEDAPRI